ncbi:lasso peptide biosynthesis PqqD family chaperone [Streptomyces microflavus]|uniref:lasso peptide biosynthesis PqqD family chaperone n=1 Tax=Streptomyces microflavus TaxID=1919 RepID=UPI00368655AC
MSIVETADGAVLLHQRTGLYWQLNSVGLHVVQGLVRGGSVEQVAEDLSRRYEVQMEQAEADIASVLQQLSEADLIRSAK